MTRPGRDFENAVATFYRRIDPSARVRSNHKVLDRDTQTWRQVDVWVELHVLNNPISVLVSCKDHARPLDIGHIEKFIAEVQSTGASNGVIYARAGFSKNAIEKARKKGVSCCRLFENAPPEEPSELLIEAFFASPSFHIAVECHDADAPSDLRWREVILPMLGRNDSKPGPLALSFSCFNHLRNVIAQTSIGHVNALPVRDSEMRMQCPANDRWPSFSVNIVLIWEWFRGRMNAYRLHGSLDKIKSSFAGTAILPRIPLTQPTNFPGWERCERPADEPTTVRVLLTGLTWPVPEMITRRIGNEPVFSARTWDFCSVDPARIPSAITTALRHWPAVNLDLQAHFAHRW